MQDQVSVLRRRFRSTSAPRISRGRTDGSAPAAGAAAIAARRDPKGKVFGDAVNFAADAVRLALDDAGSERHDLGGLLVNPGLTWNDQGMGSFQLQQALGLRDLRLTATMNLGGATACAMVQHAAQAIAAGLCQTVACVFSDAPLKPPSPQGGRTSSGAAYGFARGFESAYGFFGVNAMYALVARRHMHRYGTTQDQLGAVAVAQRRWAALNPAAQMHDRPMTLDDYRASRWIVEPFHVYDCCLVSNGGLAVIVTSAARADCASPGVHPGYGAGASRRGPERHADLRCGAGQGAGVRHGGRHAFGHRRRGAL